MCSFPTKIVVASMVNFVPYVNCQTTWSWQFPSILCLGIKSASMYNSPDNFVWGYLVLRQYSDINAMHSWAFRLMNPCAHTVTYVSSQEMSNGRGGTEGKIKHYNMYIYAHTYAYKNINIYL